MMIDLNPFERRALRAAMRRQRRYIVHDIDTDQKPGARELHSLRLTTLDELMQKITDPSEDEVTAYLALQGRAP